ncbi:MULTISPECIES: SIR2 family NAD-dependent protein deacylase [Pseudomonas]|jgi:NAD-dependent deacetylase|uniref:NAD-dependent protein deacylase n=1 Tax=Pseudomonas fragi TaxID=296 RepID=A0A9Q5FSE9_PSEFR|nr:MULTISPECIES: NAD-dependent protein deacylase [Pseudomonas]ETK22266.1 NAD-dependent deacetylase [Pseudomonas sp. FH1]MBL7229908.1 NAD-dependent protein deacylase [Pseudomonas sp.]NMZ14118.1 NAD-dependent protein deacylase [Pseudomonas proteolytica]NNB27504.1 NAD-dependent protein deacylase [Pseudomonas fragi]NNB36745.1 NAD-dependent protein deacylase [Pseudomonas fragi]
MLALERAKISLLKARTITCFSGAGISAESGISTYRDPLAGLWSQYDPEKLETAKAFRENPRLVWGWYLWRRQQVARSQPNVAHRAFCQMAATGRTVSIITQNVDDLHERAGSHGVLHLHGSLATPKCFACHRPAELAQDQLAVPVEGALIEPPRCRRCGGKLRPGVVWYGEDLSRDVWKSAMSLVRGCDILISVGTSGIVTPAADIPRLALASGALLIHVNTEDVSLGEHNEIMLIGNATGVLAQLSEFLESDA